MFLHDAEGSVNQKTLERHLMIKPSTVNGIVERLEEKGLVYRTVSATDGRCRILALTEEGQRFHDDFQTVLHQVNERLERGFTHGGKGAVHRVPAAGGTEPDRRGGGKHDKKIGALYRRATAC